MSMPAPAADAMLRVLGRMPAAARAHMVQAYLQALQSQPGLLADALAAGDRRAARSQAHKLAGAAAMVFDQPVLQAAQRLEKALAGDAGPPPEADLARLQACAAASAQALRQAFAPGG